MSITKDDFKVSGDTCVWMIFCILILAIVGAYSRGMADQRIKDNMELYEDVLLGKVNLNSQKEWSGK